MKALEILAQARHQGENVSSTITTLRRHQTLCCNAAANQLGLVLVNTPEATMDRDQFAGAFMMALGNGEVV